MMKRLYFKILLYWVIALIVTEVLIFGLFLLVVKDGHHSYFVESIGRSTVIARDYIEAAVTDKTQQGGRKIDLLQNAVIHLGESTHAKVWVARTDGTPLAASFGGEIKEPRINHDKTGVYEDAVINIGIGQKPLSYSKIPVNLANQGKEKAILHILTERQLDRFPHGKFAAGLALIGVFIAAIAVPLSRHITKPLNNLKESTLRIAEGDLSSRADVHGNDEIGSLGKAFNSMAETVERMIRSGRELTANVSHEMRSPLARIRVAGECLKESVARGDKADSAELLEVMWEDIDEADRMIGRILEYSKLDLHDPVPAIANVRPAMILDSLFRTMRPLFRSKRITVETDMEQNLSVSGDEEWLRAAFKNLLENSARYTPENGHVHLTMRQEGARMIFELTNSAKPVADDELELIFNPFHRGNGVNADGVGLGLAITQKIIRRHNGEIGARNTPQGFQVWLWLPESKPEKST